MRDTRYEILVWLPSPMGDAILCTPALRAIRRYFKSSRITFFANSVVRQLLSPNRFSDAWLLHHGKNPFAIAKILKERKFTHAILFKNSFASGLASFLAKIPSRIGYAREGRGFMLTDKLYPPKATEGKFKPISMIDYYLAIASWLGCDTADRNLELLIDPKDEEKVKAALPELTNHVDPIVVIVPGGAFGPSKCWQSLRFAQTADWMINNYGARVFISVSSAHTEKKIAKEICNSSEHELLNLADRPISVGQLKSLFSIADLVISNDTGPRHIAIALHRKLITLFGPNDPAWTDTGYEEEIQIIGNAPCAPCQKPICKEKQHLCMNSISVEIVCDAAKKLLEDSQKNSALKADLKFVEMSKSFFVDSEYKTEFNKLGLTSVDAVFSFSDALNLTKENLASYRSRWQFETNSPPATLFLKRYDLPPVLVQLKNWLLSRKLISCGLRDRDAASKLAAAGINTPKTISYGEKWGTFLEKRSFIITEKIPNAQSLERRLPDYFNSPITPENLKLRRTFITRLAAFIKNFHQTKYCHRDLYFSHIFYSDNGEFYLIDLARTFKPFFFARRFRIKDIAQLHYSAPRSSFSRTDRLRFYLGFAGRDKLIQKDKIFIRKVVTKAERMAQHDTKHGRPVPFANCQC
ncbi:MAG: lipopolysaccharide heptosyltransferase II [Planctomycetota bacterium]|nr:MAG: lipopolysaccharide heptosyltransferase II [Planctomycetota bacterium]